MLDSYSVGGLGPGMRTVCAGQCLWSDHIQSQLLPVSWLAYVTLVKMLRSHIGSVNSLSKE